MIDLIINRLFKNTIYVQFSAEWISVKHVETGKTIEDKPLLALKKNRKGRNVVLAVGSEVEQIKADPGVVILNGFSHPRVCISDFEIAQATLMHFVRKALNKTVFIRPTMIVHPKGNLEGGLSTIEDRALKELASAAGARKSYIWIGQKLEDAELISLIFPKTTERRKA